MPSYSFKSPLSGLVLHDYWSWEFVFDPWIRQDFIGFTSLEIFFQLPRLFFLNYSYRNIWQHYVINNSIIQIKPQIIEVNHKLSSQVHNDQQKLTITNAKFQNIFVKPISISISIWQHDRPFDSCHIKLTTVLPRFFFLRLRFLMIVKGRYHFFARLLNHH